MASCGNRNKGPAVGGLTVERGGGEGWMSGMGSPFIGVHLALGEGVERLVGDVWHIGMAMDTLAGTKGARARQLGSARVAEAGRGNNLIRMAGRWVCLKPLIRAGHMTTPQQRAMEAAAARPGGRCGAGTGEAVRPQKVCVEQ
jgi:hypothetical protein